MSDLSAITINKGQEVFVIREGLVFKGRIVQFLNGNKMRVLLIEVPTTMVVCEYGRDVFMTRKKVNKVLKFNTRRKNETTPIRERGKN